MAMDNQSYKYIYNSFSKTQNKQGTNTLSVGSTIQNLLVDLNENNIYNPNFTDYYGTDGKLSTKWCCATEGEVKKTKTVTGEYYTQRGIQERAEESAITIGTLKNGQYEHNHSFILPEGVDTSTISVMVNDRSALYVLGERYVQVSVRIGLRRATMRISYKYTKPIYVYRWSGKDLDYDVTNNTSDKMSITRENKILTIEWETEIIGKSPSATLDYVVKGSEKQEETIQHGLLLHQVVLKPHTSYVLQVVNMTESKNTEEKKQNKIESESCVYKFDQYLFFQTGPRQESFTLYIYGASFGYKTFGRKVNDNDEVEFFQLRSFEAPIQTKVFLFESSMPWVVNDVGTIVGLKEYTLKCQQETNDNGVSASFSDEEIMRIFQERPKLEISSDKKTLVVNLPGGLLENSTNWKYEDLWEYTYNNAKLSMMDNMYLVTVRNYLTEEVRSYDRGTCQTQYGILRTIQRTRTSNQDLYSNAEGELKTYKIQIKQIPILQGKAKYNPIQLSWAEGKVSIQKTLNVSLPIISLLGYNYTYTKRREVSPINYQYTSVSFAWAYFDGSKYNIISDYSIPLIVDRQSALIKKEVNGTYLLECQERTLTSKTNTEYYKADAIYLE